MKELVVLSGKGGTGKTSIVGCFAALAQSKVMATCARGGEKWNQLTLSQDTQLRRYQANV